MKTKLDITAILNCSTHCQYAFIRKYVLFHLLCLSNIPDSVIISEQWDGIIGGNMTGLKLFSFVIVSEQVALITFITLVNDNFLYHCHKLDSLGRNINLVVV